MFLLSTAEVDNYLNCTFDIVPESWVINLNSFKYLCRKTFDIVPESSASSSEYLRYCSWFIGIERVPSILFLSHQIHLHINMCTFDIVPESSASSERKMAPNRAKATWCSLSLISSENSLCSPEVIIARAQICAINTFSIPNLRATFFNNYSSILVLA